MRRSVVGLSMFLALALTACGDGSASDVSLNFKAVDTSASALQNLQQGLSTELVGDNGTLTIDEVLLIVDEVKLESVEGACETPVVEGAVLQGDEDDEVEVEEEAEVEEERDCETFESGPYFIQLPLDGTSVQAFQEPVPAGTYQELKFEVAPRPERVADELAAAGFDNWPEEASMYVAGSFLPAGATEAQPFELFLDAEVKIEMAFPQPMVIDGSSAGADITVELDPAAWFAEADGSVTDLTQYAQGELVKFEYKVEAGFSGVEVKIELGEEDDDEDHEVDEDDEELEEVDDETSET